MFGLLPPIICKIAPNNCNAFPMIRNRIVQIFIPILAYLFLVNIKYNNNDWMIIGSKAIGFLVTIKVDRFNNKSNEIKEIKIQ